MQEAVQAARRAARTLQTRARDASRALAVLEAELGEPLDSFEIAAGQPVPVEVLDLIRAAADGQTARDSRLVLAVPGRPDQGSNHVGRSADQGSRNGQARVGV